MTDICTAARAVEKVAEIHADLVAIVREMIFGEGTDASVQRALDLCNEAKTRHGIEPEPSADEIEARSRGWKGESEGLPYFAGSGVIHPAGRWASSWTDALDVDVSEGWQGRVAPADDDIPW